MYRDREGMAFPAGSQATRDIDIGDVEPTCDDDPKNPRGEPTCDDDPKDPRGEPTRDDDREDPREEAVTVPDLKGQTRAAAETALKKVSLKLAAEGQDKRGNVVLKQSPAAGKQVAPKTTIRVGLGPRQKS